ncbi:hypothetical protein BDF19DRAFT_424868 [Syncephalis fuscata]|nr:hypothetical protein BDF19DRAFT_424868 [Syncephalis fuscata]
MHQSSPLKQQQQHTDTRNVDMTMSSVPRHIQSSPLQLQEQQQQQQQHLHQSTQHYQQQPQPQPQYQHNPHLQQQQQQQQSQTPTISTLPNMMSPAAIAYDYNHMASMTPTPTLSSYHSTAPPIAQPPAVSPLLPAPSSSTLDETTLINAYLTELEREHLEFLIMKIPPHLRRALLHRWM